MAQNARMFHQDYQAGPQIIGNPGHIARVLKRLHKARALLNVSFTGRRGEFRSAVLEVEPRRSYLILDELSPERGHDLVSVGGQLRVYCRNDGVETRFVTTVREIDLDNGIYFYRTDFPQEIYYHQRRQFVRVPVRLGIQRTVKLFGEEREISAEMFDVSVGGFGAYLKQGPEVARGELYDYFIELDGYGAYEGTVEIRHTIHDKVRRRQRFGVQFMDLKTPQRTRIERLVAALQRELLRTT